ncbi:MAG: hypothetical protein JXX28_14495 [Deltaproteobacteria bacterium]|nr:hypothetical protein [Deltaproteobacteria bacterium]
MRVSLALVLSLALVGCGNKEEEVVDIDGDGYSSATDCDDTDASVHPDADEVCDGLDNDCDTEVDEDPVDATDWYPDVDQDRFGDGSAPSAACDAPVGYVADDSDCDDHDPRVHPGAAETDCADPIDYNCDGSVGYADVDGDGHPACEECDDTDAAVNPGASEVPYDGVDNDCEPLTPDDDLDGDGADHDVDCDDSDIFVGPDAPEIPYDGVDNDCDPATLDDDLDGDGFPRATDCVDDDPAVNPGASEVPHDGIDNDCVGGDSKDADGDGYDASHAGGDDCDDTDAAIHPNAAEVPYDGVDNDCLPSTLDDDLDRDGADADVDCDDGDPARSPFLSEVPYDGVDNDCRDGDLTDVDGDGFAGTAAPGGTDCDDRDASVNPSKREVAYDGVDNDCSSATLDDDLDGDGDLFTTGDDCDDRDPEVGSSQAEVWYNGVDNDCSGGSDFDQDGDGVDLSDDDPDGADCDDGDPAVGACQLGIFPGTAPTSCVAVAEQAPDYPSGQYWIRPAGSTVGAFQAWCDQAADGGGYTLLKMTSPGDSYAPAAEAACAERGMRLLIPRTQAHIDAAWRLANDPRVGLSASANYLRVLGIYPSVNRATCSGTPLSSDNSLCGWRAGDGGPFYVQWRFNISEPNGDNATNGSQYYAWVEGEGGSARLSWHNDVVAGYATREWLCDTADKLGPEPTGLPASCLEILLDDPAAADGVYAIDPIPGVTGATEVVCDMSTDGGGWTLIGKGREGWTWDYAGQGDPAGFTDLADDAVVTLPARTVHALMGGYDGAPMELVDGLRIDREEMGQLGLKWTFTNMRVFDWNLASLPAPASGVANPSWSVEYTTPAGEIFHGTTKDVGSVTDSGANLNDYRRVFTWSWEGHDYLMGWSAGSGGDKDTDGDGIRDVEDGFTFEDHTHALPFTTVWVRQ